MTLNIFLKRILIKLINFYQIAISPYLGQNCRFYPSCSSYAIEAIEKKGIIKGTILSLWRILRCNPLNKGGIDHVK
ncbi:MAG: membrane protein insertion efficiency factor YidD [Deferribacterales bacterium]